MTKTWRTWKVFFLHSVLASACVWLSLAFSSISRTFVEPSSVKMGSEGRWGDGSSPHSEALCKAVKHVGTFCIVLHIFRCFAFSLHLGLLFALESGHLQTDLAQVGNWGSPGDWTEPPCELRWFSALSPGQGIIYRSNPSPARVSRLAPQSLLLLVFGAVHLSVPKKDVFFVIPLRRSGSCCSVCHGCLRASLQMPEFAHPTAEHMRSEARFTKSDENSRHFRLVSPTVVFVAPLPLGFDHSPLSCLGIWFANAKLVGAQVRSICPRPLSRDFLSLIASSNHENW